MISKYSEVIFILALGLVVLGLILFLQPDWQFKSDAFNQYNWLRSLWLDGDWDFANEGAYFRQTFQLQAADYYDRPTQTGLYANPFPVGIALLLSPFFYLGYLIAGILGEHGEFSGYTAPYFVSMSIGSIFLLLAGLYAALRWLKNIFHSRWAPYVAVAAVLLGTHLLNYVVYEPLWNHALSAAAASVLLFAWWKWKDDVSLSRALVWGLLLGLLVLIRWQDLVFAAFPLWTLLCRRDPKRLFAFGATAVAVFLPQMVAWQVVYGKPFLLPESSTIFNPLAPKLLAFLFNSSNGMFIWTPLLLAAIGGLVVLVRNKEFRAIALLSLVVVGAEVWINASVSDWWGGGGGAFGARRMLSSTPLFALGIAALWQHLKPALFLRNVFIAFITFCIFLNVSLMVQAAKGMLTREPTLKEQALGISEKGLHVPPSSVVFANDITILREWGILP